MPTILDSVYKIGNMEITKKPMSVLLVFPSEDDQFRAFQSAAVSLGYQCDSEDGGIDALLQKYNNLRPDLVVMDTRSKSRFDPEAMCRCLRESNSGESQVIIVAITSKGSEASVAPLLNAGFNRRWIENMCVIECANEMLMIEKNDRQRMIQHSLLDTFVTSLDNVNDAVEIVNSNFRIEVYQPFPQNQYINAAYMHMLGYSKREEIQVCTHLRNNQSISESLQRGFPWTGNITAHTKLGRDLNHFAQFIPVIDSRGHAHHFVGLHSPVKETCTSIASEISSKNSAFFRDDFLPPALDIGGLRQSCSLNEVDTRHRKWSWEPGSSSTIMMDSQWSTRSRAMSETAQSNNRKSSWEPGTIATRGKSLVLMHSDNVKPEHIDTLEIMHDETFAPVKRSSNRRRRESIARIHGMPIEGPITKVINIINGIQASSTPTIAHDLDKVVDILLTSDLFSGAINAERRPDQMTTDLVEGLMTNVKVMNDRNEKRRMSINPIQPSVTRTSRNSEVMIEHIKQVLDGSTNADLKYLSVTEMPEEIAECLEHDMSWTFDILRLERVSEKRPLVYLGMKIMDRFGVAQFLKVSPITLRNWLQVIEENYRSSNPYHNSTHAADVMQASAYFLSKDRIKGILEPVDEVSTLLAAVVHDLDHPGRTNPFLINSGHRLAILYNDSSVLESHHVALAFSLSKKDERIDIFKNLSKDDHRLVRQYMIDLVLATEMAKHFEHLAKFVSNIAKPFHSRENGRHDRGACSTVAEVDEDSAAAAGGVNSGGGEQNSSSGDEDDEESYLRSMSTPENRAIVKRMLIKCCDVSNPSRPLETYKVWAMRIAEEYFDQTDEERDKGLPIVMPMFDRKTCDIPKSQISFIDFFLKDMFEMWQGFCETPEVGELLLSNYVHWREKADAVAAIKE